MNYKFNDDTLIHGISFNPMKLEGILKYGIVSENYARSNNIPYSKNYNFTIDEEIKIKKKRFCGIIINNYNIELKNEEEFELWCKENKICIENYNKNDLYEGYSLINGLNKEKINIFL